MGFPFPDRAKCQGRRKSHPLFWCGAGWSEKVFSIVEDYSANPGKRKPSLRVCLDGMSGEATSNCCRCEKCLRAIASLVVCGENPSEWGSTTAILFGKCGRNLLEHQDSPLQRLPLAENKENCLGEARSRSEGIVPLAFSACPLGPILTPFLNNEERSPADSAGLLSSL